MEAIRIPVSTCTRRYRECQHYSSEQEFYADELDSTRHLMVKDGLLSPRSKLVQTSRNNTPLPGDRPSSVFSVASSGEFHSQLTQVRS